MSRTTAPQQINHIEGMSSVTLAVRPKMGVPLQETMRELEEEIIAPLRAAGTVPSSVLTVLAGTADKLTETRHALIGDFDGALQRPRLFGLSVGASIGLLVLLVLAIIAGASIVGGIRTGVLTGMVTMAALVLGLLLLNRELALTLVQSRAVLALLITYLLMAALFESFLYPVVIMFTVPLATIGGFAALRLVHEASLYDISSPIQQLDMLTMLGFVILVGIVVNNAILIVHQALNFMRCDGLPAAQAVVRSVETRTRPIFMSAMTSVFGMAPLVVMSGAGSELYRGLGSVVLGGLLVSTVFTLVMVPAMFTLILDARAWLGTVVQRPGALSEAIARPAPASPGSES